jgi:uncharacterized membrane protein YdbT with pleckstrin-like domain
MSDSSHDSAAAHRDLYWAGPSGWATVPGILVGGAVSAVAMIVMPPLGEWVRLPADWTAFVVFWLVILVWAFVGLVWIYRGACFVYRLTPSHIFLDFGWLYRPTAAIALDRIETVKIRAWLLRRLFHVGAVVIIHDGQSTRLRSVFRPELFADAIRAAIQQMKAHGT